MNKAPEFDLPKRLPVSRIRAGRRFWRIHAASHDALWFGPKPDRPPLNRFDDPQGEFHICYLAASPEIAFAETFLRNPPVHILSLTDLEERRLTVIEAASELHLVRMHGTGLSQLGVTAEVSSGADYRHSQPWSRAIWMHRDQPNGILYRPRHDDSALCAAVYDRAQSRLAVGTGAVLTKDSRALAKLLGRYRLGVTA